MKANWLWSLWQAILLSFAYGFTRREEKTLPCTTTNNSCTQGEGKAQITGPGDGIMPSRRVGVCGGRAQGAILIGVLISSTKGRLMSGGVGEGGGAAEAPWIEVTGSPHLAGWLAQQRLSLAFTTYQTGKLFFLGLRPDGGLAVFERTFSRAMGLWADGQTLWLGTLYQLWRFENALKPGFQHNGCDRLYIPKVGYTTGDLDVHDVAVEANGRVVFVNTKFGCLATLHERDSFTPLWRPPFVSKLAAEDRCHLNGLALADGRPAYVTAVAPAVGHVAGADHGDVTRPTRLQRQAVEVAAVLRGELAQERRPPQGREAETLVQRGQAAE